MKITAIYGTSHAGSTVLLARILMQSLPQDNSSTFSEFFLPQDFSHFCSGCCACFEASEPLCQQAPAQLKPILQAIDASDVILLASPVYAYHVTGAMKSFLDRLGNRWIVHRPNSKLAHKTAVLLATAAGSGIRQTLRDMKDSVNWWGVGRVYTYGIRSMALKAAELSESRKEKMRRDMQRLARRLQPAPVEPRCGVRMRYWLSRKMGGGLTASDHAYWKTQGWMDGKSPWK